MIKLCFIDLETTGTDPTRNGIIQIAGIIDIDGIEKENFNFKVTPFENDVIEELALQVNNISLSDIQKFPTSFDVYVKIINLFSNYIDKYNKLDKFHFIGYNASFDDSFFRQWFKKNNDNYYGSWFYWPPLDLANLIAFKSIENRSEYFNFKLMTVAEKFGINIDSSKAHDALYDIQITRQLFYKIA